MNPTPPEIPTLTDQQTRPLAVVGASIALASGAGCGKTTVLTARFLGDLDGDRSRPLRSIVALTFTRKAARELRKRIRARCRNRLDTGTDTARWRSVLRGLEAAPIGTFHEFCGQWLRTHAVDAGIDPDFIILDESIAGTIRDEALGRCLHEWLADSVEDSDLIELAVEFGLARVRDALSDLIAHRAIGDLDRWTVRSTDQIVETWNEVWNAKGRAARLHKVVQVARRCVDFLVSHEGSHLKMRERRAFLLEHLPGIERPDVSDALLGEIREQAKVQGAGTKDHWPTAEIFEQVKKHFADLRSEIDTFAKSGEWDEAATRAAAESGLRLARLAIAFRQTYAAAKRARGGLDFDDLLLMTRDLLRKRPELAGDASQEMITRLLVDEFQDTDEAQGEILRCFGGNAFKDGRLFLVGDEKQSIYRFRGAEPRIFQDFRAEFPAEGHHALTENFRSVPAILDFVNALFLGTFPESDQRLVAGPKTFPDNDQPAVEFLWAAEAGSDETEKSRTLANERRKIEARWIACRLRQRLDAGWRVRDKKGELKTADAGDIVLLFRAMTGVGVYESALADEGFDYHVVGGSAFYAQQEVHDLINVLSVIEDPLDPVSLTGALRSPFFCVSDDGLYWLVTSRFGDLAGGLAHADEIAELSSLDRGHAVRARGLLGRWRELKDRVPIAALVDRVLDESGYEASLLGEFLGARKRANARKLVRLARQFDQQGGFAVADFVARLRSDLRRVPREEQAATTDEGGKSVRLMSIHQAKGLEFPIVVLPDLNRKPGGGHDFAAFHPLLGPLVRGGKDLVPGDEAESDGTGQSLGWLTYQAIEQREEDAESMRLFYVATTRARDALILSAGLSPAEKPASPAMTLLSGRFDRATGACLASLPEGWAVPEVHVTCECPSRSESKLAVTGSGRPALEEVAAAITSAPVRGDTAPGIIRRSRPRFVDLDPALGLSPYGSRLDRLIRAILADPRALAPKDLARVAAEAARRQQPAAPSVLIAEALDRLRPWVEGAFGQKLAGAATIERGLSWTIAWPPRAEDRTVFQGTIDFLTRDRQGDWTAVAVSIAEASTASERLRLLLAARAATALGFGPIRQGWLLRIGPGGGLQGEDRFESQDIDDTLRDERLSSLWGV